MRSVDTRRDDRVFWDLTRNLEWRLDDSGGGPTPPAQPPEFDRGGGGSVWPTWATHMVAFLLGALTFGWLLVAPVVAAMIVLAGVVGTTALAAKRRWH